MLGKPPRPSLGGAHGNNDNRKGKTATGTSGHGHHKSRRDKKKQKQKQKQKQRKPHETRAERNARINAEQRQRRLAAIAKARSMERVMMRLRRRGMPIPGPGEPVPTEEDVPATPRREFMSMPSDALDRALQAENVKGNRVAQVVGTQYVVDDFNLLEQDVLTCQVCKVGLPGRHARPASELGDMYSLQGGSVLLWSHCLTYSGTRLARVSRLSLLLDVSDGR